LAAEDDYNLREQQLVERIQNVDPAWLEEDPIPQSIQFMIDLIPNYRRFLKELQRRARLWVLVYVPYEEKSMIPVHHNSFTEKTVKSLEPKMLQIIESPAWKAPVEKKDEVRRCILFVMKGFAPQKANNSEPQSAGEDQRNSNFGR
jgi:hypothetical protein